MTEELSLGRRQELFSRLIAEHMIWLDKQGYQIRCGDFFRDPRVHGDLGEKVSYSSANSNHKLKLAADLNLFRDGEYLNRTLDHKFSGDKWEKRHPLCRWGGRWDDGNHYEITQ